MENCFDHFGLLFDSVRYFWPRISIFIFQTSLLLQRKILDARFGLQTPISNFHCSYIFHQVWSYSDLGKSVQMRPVHVLVYWVYWINWKPQYMSHRARLMYFRFLLENLDRIFSVCFSNRIRPRNINLRVWTDILTNRQLQEACFWP